MALAGCCDLTRQAREYIDTVSETNRSFPTPRRHKPTLRTGRPGTSPPARETRCHHLRNAFRSRCIQAHGAVSDKLRLHDRQMEKSRIQVLSLILSENLSRHWTNDRKHRMCTKTRTLDGTARYSGRNSNCAHHVTAILSPRRPWAMEAATPASTQLRT